MQDRKKSPQELLMQKIQYLVPDAVLSIRLYDNNEHLVKNPVIRGEFLIDWDKTKGDCPELDKINSVTDEQINERELAEQKKCRNKQNACNLAMVACYEMAKKENPDLVFSDYLDYLESISVSL